MPRNSLLITVNCPDFFVSHRLPIALGARSAGYDVEIATPPGPGVATIREHGFTHHPYPLQRWGLHPLGELNTFRSLVNLYSKLKPELVHHVTIKPVLYGSIAARLTGVPRVVDAVSGMGYVFSSSDTRARLIRPWVRFLYRTAFGHRRLRVIVQNEDDRQGFIDNRVLTQNRLVLIKGSGVDPHEFIPVGTTQGTLRVGLPSRMLVDKGVGEFIEAVRLLKQKNIAAQFVLIGDIETQNPSSFSKGTITQWVDAGLVEWWGHRSDMVEVFHKLDIVCLPSYREGLPKVLIEAASCGLPIVTTDVPGCREIVREDDNGLLVPPKNAPVLADKLEMLIRDPELRQRLGQRGRERVVNEFSTDHVVQQTLNVYRSLFQ